MRPLALPLLLSAAVFANELYADAPNAETNTPRAANSFEARADALRLKLTSAAAQYTRGNHERVVKLLEGLDKEIDALAVEFPKKRSILMPGILKSVAYCLLAATYQEQNEVEKSRKYEALVKKPFKIIGHDLDFDEYLRLVLRDYGPKGSIKPGHSSSSIGVGR